MAQAGNSLAARLRKLEGALAKAGKLKRGSTLSARPMAELLGVTWVALRGWCDDIAGFEESAAFVRGGNGIEWEFRPGPAIRFLIKHFKAEIAASAKRAKRVRAIVGGNALDQVPDDFSLDETRKIVQLSAAIQDQRERQGELIDARLAAEAFRAYHDTLQSAVLRAGQQQDPNGRWDPQTRESFEDAMRSVLAEAQRAGRKCLAKLNGGAA